VDAKPSKYASRASIDRGVPEVLSLPRTTSHLHTALGANPNDVLELAHLSPMSRIRAPGMTDLSPFAWLELTSPAFNPLGLVHLTISRSPCFHNMANNVSRTRHCNFGRFGEGYELAMQSRSGLCPPAEDQRNNLWAV
jgi:hypothetical protein